MMNFLLDRSENAITVDVVSIEALTADLFERLAKGIGFSVATLNLDHVVKLSRDSNFVQAYSRHSHITADGNPIVWLSRLAGQPDVSLVPGSDLIGPIVSVADDLDIPIGIIGSTSDSLDTAAAKLMSKHPSLKIELLHSPNFNFDPLGADGEEVIRLIEVSGVRIVFLALGAPKQEIFAAVAGEALLEVGFLSVGAGIDFISGHQKRSPKVLRTLGLEWLWRLALNPRRLAVRYASCAMVLPVLVLRALERRRSNRGKFE